jgi:hypothetical protein
MNIDVIKRRVLGAEATKGLFAEKYADGLSFCFSVFKLSSSATRAVRGRNIVSTDEADIGFENDVMSASEISALGNGSGVVAPIFYNQKGSYVGNLLANTAIATRPAIVDNSNQPIDFIRTRVQGEGYWTPNTITPAPDMSGDYVVSLVTGRETSTVNQRPTIYIKSSATDNFTVMTRRISGLNPDVIVSVIIDRETSVGSDFQFIATNQQNLNLITFIRLNNQLNAFFNSNPITLNSTTENSDSRGGSGVGLNTRPISLASGRINDFQSYILHTGNDLSNFPIQDYLNDLKAIHGIP